MVPDPTVLRHISTIRQLPTPEKSPPVRSTTTEGPTTQRRLRNPEPTSRVRIVDGDLPNRRLIDRCDSPASNRSQTSDFSNSENRRTTHLHIETLQLSSKGDATTP